MKDEVLRACFAALARRREAPATRSPRGAKRRASRCCASRCSKCSSHASAASSPTGRRRFARPTSPDVALFAAAEDAERAVRDVPAVARGGAARRGRRRRRARTACSSTAISPSASTRTPPTCGPTPKRTSKTCRSARRPTSSTRWARTGACRRSTRAGSRAKATPSCSRSCSRTATPPARCASTTRSRSRGCTGSRAAPMPRSGTYVEYPLDDVRGIVALASVRERCVVIGEDLGTVPEGFRERMAATGILSYRILFFERRLDGTFVPPEEYPALALATSGTHDLPTIPAWLRGEDVDLRDRLQMLETPHAARARRARTRASALPRHARRARRPAAERARRRHGGDRRGEPLPGGDAVRDRDGAARRRRSPNARRSTSREPPRSTRTGAVSWGRTSTRWHRTTASAASAPSSPNSAREQRRESCSDGRGRGLPPSPADLAPTQTARARRRQTGDGADRRAAQAARLRRDRRRRCTTSPTRSRRTSATAKRTA